MTHIPSSVHHARHEPVLVGRRLGSNLDVSGQSKATPTAPINTWVKQNQSVGTNQVDSASTGFATEQENELLSLRIVELVHEFLSFVNRHCTIEPKEAISGPWLVSPTKSLSQLRCLLFRAA